jgi:hypothetical protein
MARGSWLGWRAVSYASRGRSVHHSTFQGKWAEKDVLGLGLTLTPRRFYAPLLRTADRRDAKPYPTKHAPQEVQFEPGGGEEAAEGGDGGSTQREDPAAQGEEPAGKHDHTGPLITLHGVLDTS